MAILKDVEKRVLGRGEHNRFCYWRILIRNVCRANFVDVKEAVEAGRVREASRRSSYRHGNQDRFEVEVRVPV
jgi:hypothetical protein